MKRGDPHRALIRALIDRYPDLVIVAGRSEPWASATFSGARHEFDCQGREVEGIEEIELPMTGHFVADITVARLEHGYRIEALTIEAG